MLNVWHDILAKTAIKSPFYPTVHALEREMQFA